MFSFISTWLALKATGGSLRAIGCFYNLCYLMNAIK